MRNLSGSDLAESSFKPEFKDCTYWQSNSSRTMHISPLIKKLYKPLSKQTFPHNMLIKYKRH